ncbi:MAG: hypothetical protein GF317_18510 [Candidatus Lokiarchaeota archaeon]|nr:hypothetical protein [Candidatus Lokiarchaeota archaeon]MBD3201509.1 hypothetical protein [Candidatus Lokiarchaeota archaeon]
MNVKIFQFNGCHKCFNETILLQKDLKKSDIEYIENPYDWELEEINVAVITGYLLPTDQEVLKKIQSISDRVIAYGSCPTTGGLYGLANQHGHEVTPLRNLIGNPQELHGCLAEIEELSSLIQNNDPKALKNLCQVCKRRSTCEFLEKVHRQLETEDEETCFNDLGFLCSGYIAKECKERCIDYKTPCRGCKPSITRPGIRMLGMFGTLMGNIEVATEASKYGATDKLADEEDDVTDSLPDIVGNFFRFSLPTSGLPKGRIPSQGNILKDLFIGRMIEEIPLILGLLGGAHSITKTLNFIETYEKENNITITEKIRIYRDELKELEGELQKAVERKDPLKYEEITTKIREIAGNMNLSNLFFGGFKTPIRDDDEFDEYRTHTFEIVEGSYKNGVLNFDLDTEGRIIDIEMKEV